MSKPNLPAMQEASKKRYFNDVKLAEKIAFENKQKEAKRLAALLDGEIVVDSPKPKAPNRRCIGVCSINGLNYFVQKKGHEYFLNGLRNNAFVFSTPEQLAAATRNMFSVKAKPVFL
jgi:3'-phosphoadenosine 5'-phosphosulfate sulfotransferase (PAPS reductase)/FAD synthetase